VRDVQIQLPVSQVVSVADRVPGRRGNSPARLPSFAETSLRYVGSPEFYVVDLCRRNVSFQSSGQMLRPRSVFHLKFIIR